MQTITQIVAARLPATRIEGTICTRISSLQTKRATTNSISTRKKCNNPTSRIGLILIKRQRMTRRLNQDKLILRTHHSKTKTKKTKIMMTHSRIRPNSKKTIHLISRSKSWIPAFQALLARSTWSAIHPCLTCTQTLTIRNTTIANPSNSWVRCPTIRKTLKTAITRPRLSRVWRCSRIAALRKAWAWVKATPTPLQISRFPSLPQQRWPPHRRTSAARLKPIPRHSRATHFSTTFRVGSKAKSSKIPSTTTKSISSKSSCRTWSSAGTWANANGSNSRSSEHFWDKTMRTATTTCLSGSPKKSAPMTNIAKTVSNSTGWKKTLAECVSKTTN